MGPGADRRGNRAHQRGAAGRRSRPYQLQAAIAAVHDEAETMAGTDWPQILALYELLEVAAPNPFTTLNRAVAVAMVHGPAAGLGVLATLAEDSRMVRHHRLLATRAHLRELAGDTDGRPPTTWRRRGRRPACRSAATCAAGRRLSG